MITYESSKVIDEKSWNMESEKTNGGIMDEIAKKTALRMIPYGLYILSARGAGEGYGAATVNWVTQASFKPPLVVVCVKGDSYIHKLIDESRAFALNVLGKGQQDKAYTFFKPAEVEDGRIGGEPFLQGKTGAPILETVPAYIECRVVDTLVNGDHTVFLGEVVDAGLRSDIEGRPDETTLWLSDLGEKIFYGG